MQYKDQSIEAVAEKLLENNKKADFDRLKKALSFILKLPTTFEHRKKEAHMLNTAFILAESGLDEETVIAGLLHHALRKKATQKEQIEKEFGKDVADLVEGIEKTDEIEEKNRQKTNPETLSKLTLATAKDIRIIFIKLAARLDSLRAISFLQESLQQEICKSTIDILVPLCHKLGMHKIRWELEDLAMKKLDPRAYEKIKKEIRQTREERERQAEKIAKRIETILKQKGLKDCHVVWRVKNFYRINKKMLEQNKKITDIHDLLAFRIICNTEKECYETLAALQENFDQTPNEFDDYIANPKPNGYKSIHCGFLLDGTPSEIQIRTWEMHNNAEDGLAAHWQYKQYKKDKHFDQRLSIAKQLTEWQREITGEKEKIDSMKLNFEGNKIFVFTPKNELIELEEGSTPIDFAFAVHSNLGMKCERAKVNGKIVPLNYKLENSDLVEIITSEKQAPKQQWLAIVKTEKAKQRIRQALAIPAIEKPKEIIKKIKTFLGLSKKAKQATRTAKCCNPLPGDKIIGVRTTKRKIVIHRADCKNISGLQESKKTAVSDELFQKGHYDVAITVHAENKPKMLPEILTLVSSSNSTTTSTNAKLLPDNTIQCTLSIKTRSLEELEKLLEKIQKTKGVKNAERA